ncbi:Uncharacterized protein APZ42_013084 [Daphnia magna]|uniref:Uncharacterized protein n=1 Tax=Daphnia magna TaxID=35525 RepID=A0A162R7E8_9CRUS|nr:Uncharacterized protein APZ42_013084 [Daphnia magna]
MSIGFISITYCFINDISCDLKSAMPLWSHRETIQTSLTDEVSLSSIDRYRIDTVPIPIFLSSADTVPILGITIADTIGIEADIDSPIPRLYSVLDLVQNSGFPHCMG